MDIHEHGHHSHHHAHGHHEHHDPAQQDEAHELVDHALILSKHWQWDHSSAVRLQDMEARVVDGLQQLAEKLAFEDMIAGHIKALLRCGGAAVSFSVTRLHDVDRNELGSLSARSADDGPELTVNILSLVNTDAVTEAELDRLFCAENSRGADI